MTQSGLIPGGSLKRDRQSVFFTAVNPMDDDQGMGEIRYNLDKPRIAPYKNTRRPYQNTVYWCNSKDRSEERIAILSNTITPFVLYNTLLAIRIEKAVCMKTKEELFHKIYNLHSCLEFFCSRIRRVDNRINLIKKQENPQTTKAHRTEVTGKLVAATLFAEYEAYLILQSKNRTRIAKKRSKS